MALIGNVYNNPSGSDPGAVGFGYGWFQSDTGAMFWRNTVNTGWIAAGNTNQVNAGMLNIGGGTMTGAILGAHGLMPVAGGDFTTAPTINGNAIATVLYVDAQIAAITATINTKITQAIATIPGLSVGSKLAIGAGISGVLGNNGTFTLPLPTYGDGTIASQAEVTGRYGAWPAVLLGADGVVNVASWSVGATETTPGSRTYQINSANTQTAPPTTGYYIGYVIIGIKA